jgi:transcriptional regulator with XRE-family HTH domain
MEHSQPINEITARAEAIGFPLRELCQAASVSLSTWWRWQQPDANPRLRDMQDAFERLDRVLSERELAVLSSLLDRYPEAAATLLNERQAVQ